MQLSFHKMNGAGNDFVVIDNRELNIQLNKEQIAWLCDRQRGIGADGLLAVEPAQKGANYRFRYYNADGGEAEMCGNGARCFGKFVSRLSEPHKKMVTFETIAGTLSAEILGDQVRIAMSTPTDLVLGSTIRVAGLEGTVHSINTGVPHVVVFVDDLENLDVVKYGAALRYHDSYAPAGTNVNFAKVLDEQHIAIRTYERGVEGETLACGTGMTACALIHHLITDAPGPIQVNVAGGDTLEIGFETYESDTFSDVTLTGPADFVYQGVITF
ncbi:diaminopimelate epimerase [Verrucomicrobiaceae bacterium N1E253]|uniref:Diaminopimelate epimerase n=1 Tax=Oceaniferula marina TaxID=2748318 RepID=A0A851GBT6_9BACT|nr:diaminopimelate epimerase [Oceaniferula marina]NWK54639.1 diaminopimelate epimerase [Oceaniferula marina]